MGSWVFINNPLGLFRNAPEGNDTPFRGYPFPSRLNAYTHTRTSTEGARGAKRRQTFRFEYLYLIDR
jgi:hypothetical protein